MHAVVTGELRAHSRSLEHIYSAAMVMKLVVASIPVEKLDALTL